MQTQFDRVNFERELGAIAALTYKLGYLELIQKFELLRCKYLLIVNLTTADQSFIVSFVNKFMLLAAIDSNQSFAEVSRRFDINRSDQFVTTSSQVYLTIEYAECCKKHQQHATGRSCLEEAKQMIANQSGQDVHPKERKQLLRLIDESMKRLRQ